MKFHIRFDVINSTSLIRIDPSTFARRLEPHEIIVHLSVKYASKTNIDPDKHFLLERLEEKGMIIVQFSKPGTNTFLL